MKRNLFFNWQPCDHFGWGIYGLNLIEWGSLDPRFTVIPLRWPPVLQCPPGPIAQIMYKEVPRQVPRLGTEIMLSAMGNQMVREPNADMNGMTEIAVIFCERNPLPEEEYQKLHEFKAVITGSTWNQQILTDKGLPCHRVIQGVDTDRFRYQSKRRFRDRFVVFSGGQLGYRKGQDLILKAFSLFARNHSDALLMTAWRAPWEQRELTSSINGSQICEPLVWEDDVHQVLINWALDNGIRADQFLPLRHVANNHMPEVLREVDIAVFPNRCEGGTNLVAMEALSAGVKCAISANTGHLDLIGERNCIPLTRQKPIPQAADLRMLDWGESDVDEIVDVLERAYIGTLPLDVCSIRGSMQQQTWEKAITNLLTAVETIAR